MTFESWGRNPKSKHSFITGMEWRGEAAIPDSDTPVLPFGQGRSYGDCCLNDGGGLLSTERLNRFISFDDESGVISCESGVSLSELLDVTVPRGWFIPVTPGTKFISVGGAIANDIHGKNQTKAGTFGRYVRSFELLRSDGERIICNRKENKKLFSATIAGLGLTGLILSAEIELKKIKGPFIDVETVPFQSLNDFFAITDDSEEKYEYTVAWIDCLTRSSSGRGVFFRGNHSERGGAGKELRARSPKISVPLNLPGVVLNTLSLSAFNSLYYWRNTQKRGLSTVHYDPFFYPLDSVANWNRIYGKRGFFQFQCVVPREEKEGVIGEILDRIASSGCPSFLGVIKCFGEVESPGMLSFPRPGITLALDFPNQGAATEDFICSLHVLVRKSGGAVYPGKDALMSAEEFREYYPRWKQFSEHIDPAFSSGFWRRVTDENNYDT